MSQKENFSTTSGDELVARASFGTKWRLPACWCRGFDYGSKTLTFLSCLDHWFVYWLSSLAIGQKRLAAILGTGGLLFAGILSHLFLGTVGGPTGILFLAAVITAGGLGGRKEATITSIIALLSITLGFFFYPDVLVMNAYLLSAGFISEETAASFVEHAQNGVPEFILITFLGSSISVGATLWHSIRPIEEPEHRLKLLLKNVRSSRIVYNVPNG